MFLLRQYARNAGDLNTRPAGRIWPARAFCAAYDTFWVFSNNYLLGYLVYSPLFKNARLSSEQVPSKRT